MLFKSEESCELKSGLFSATKRYLIESYLMLNDNQTALTFFEEFNKNRKNFDDNAKQICSLLIMIYDEKDYLKTFKM